LKSAEEEVPTRRYLVSGIWPLASDRWQNSEKTGAKAAIFGQKADKTEQRVDKKGQTTDKLGIRNNTYKTPQKPLFQPKNKEIRRFYQIMTNAGFPKQQFRIS